MSYQAMAWAVKQRVGNPTRKLILLALANYADDHGSCFPSQKRLAHEAECSERSVWQALKDLESADLLKRERRRRDDGTWSSDTIVLSMFLPAANSAEGEAIHSQNTTSTIRTSCGAEPVSEPIRTADDSAGARASISRNEEDELRAAAGKSLNQSSPNLLVMAEPIRWRNAGMDLRDDILPAISAAAAKAPPGRIRSWNYFTDAIADWHASRTAPMPEGRVLHHPAAAKKSTAQEMKDALNLFRSGADRQQPAPDTDTFAGTTIEAGDYRRVG